MTRLSWRPRSMELKRYIRQEMRDPKRRSAIRVARLRLRSTLERYLTPIRCWCGWSRGACFDLHPGLHPGLTKEVVGPYRCYVRDHCVPRSDGDVGGS